MNELSKLLGGAERLRLIRLFLKDYKKEYTLAEIENKTKIKSDILKKELLMMLSIGLLDKYKTKVYSLKKGVSLLKEATVYAVKADFKYLEAMNALFLDYTTIDRSLLLSKIKGQGRIKYFMLSGIFTAFEKARLDILIVGDQINVKEIERNMSNISIELGRDVRYVVMDLEEFMYRRKMMDAFLEEVLSGKNEILIDKLPRI